MSKVRDPETVRIQKEMREKCERCGRPFALHGAAPPHAHGDDCVGFKAKRKAKEQP